MISLVVEGPPPRKNERHEIVTPRHRKRGMPPAWLKNSAAFDSFVLRTTNRWRRAGKPRANAGRWHVSIRNFWPTMRHLDVDVPNGDVDSTVSQILDALQECRCVDNDARFVSAWELNFYDRENPRVEFDLVPLAEFSEQLEITDGEEPEAYRAMTAEMVRQLVQRLGYEPG